MEQVLPPEVLGALAVVGLIGGMTGLIGGFLGSKHRLLGAILLGVMAGSPRPRSLVSPAPNPALT
ncbi:MAG: hypothetical protein ABR609_07115 [Acidimicrobiia bacterium]